MKKLIIPILFLLGGCYDYDAPHYEVRDQTQIVVLNKHIREMPVGRGPRVREYQIYLFDGESAQWYDVSAPMFERYEINDTIQNIVITKTIYKDK